MDDMSERAAKCTYGNPDCPQCNPKYELPMHDGKVNLYKINREVTRADTRAEVNTILEALIAHAKAEEREAVAKYVDGGCGGWATPGFLVDLANIIRNMGD